jgi:hypothetical protein
MGMPCLKKEEKEKKPNKKQMMGSSLFALVIFQIGFLFCLRQALDHNPPASASPTYFELQLCMVCSVR